MTDEQRQRREGVTALAAGGLAALAIVAAVLVASSPSALGTRGSSPGPSSSAGETSSPRPSSSPTSGPADDEPQAIDPYYGDVVVSAPIGTAPGEFSNGLTLKLVSVSEEQFTGSGIGTTSGQAVVVELELTNESDAAEEIAATVTAYAGSDRTPLAPVNGGDTDEPFDGSIAASSTARATYRFVLDPDASPLWFAVSIGADSGLVVLEYR